MVSRSSSRLSTACVLAAGLALAALPAAASSPTAASSPRAGFVDAAEVVAVGWQGPLTVGWLNHDESQRFRVSVTGPEGYRFEESFRIDEGSSVRRDVPIPATDAVGGYTARFLDADGDVVFDHVFRAARPVRVDASPVTPASFLPRVRDGVRDTTRLAYRLDRAARVTGRVLEVGSGRVVRSVDLGRRTAGTHAWVWSGHADRGGVVDRGRYVMRVEATSDALTTTAVRGVRVASYRSTEARHVARRGVRTTSRSPGACVLSGRRGSLTVDCSAAPPGRGAGVTWRFRPGRDARGVRSAVTGGGFATDPGQVSVHRRRDGGALTVVLRVRPGATYTMDLVRARWRAPVMR